MDENKSLEEKIKHLEDQILSLSRIIILHEIRIFELEMSVNGTTNHD